MDDRELLQEYVERQAEPAFAELVARHLPIVLGTAQRLVREPQAAEDVAQTVFIQLARKAWTIRQGQSLSGWLYRATQHAALDALRKEHRRQQRETSAMKFAETQNAPDPAWEEFAPLVDEAMRQLKRGEQDALLLRFFEDKTYGEVGRILGLDERTACQRVNRALEKMRGHLARRGVTTTATLLASAITAHAAVPLSTGMAAQVAGTSLAGAGTGAFSASVVKTFFYMTTKTKIALAAAVFIAAATVSTLTQQREISRLRTELAAKSARPAAPPRTGQIKANGLPHNLPWDPHGPLADILKKYKGADRVAAILKLVDETAVPDLAHLMDEAAACPEFDIGLNVYSLANSKWAHSDPDGALSYAYATAKKPGFLPGATALSPVFTTWAADDPPGALAAAAKLDRTSFRAAAVGQVLSIWAQGDHPLDAVNAAKSMPKGLLKTDPLLTVFQAWAEMDPAAALANLSLIDSASTRRSVQSSIITTIADSDPKQALDILHSLPVGQQNTQLYASVFKSWAELDPVAALATLQSLPPGAVRNAATQSVYSGWAELDPAAALQAIQSLPPGQARNLAQQSVLNELVQQDPEAAAQYLATLPPGSYRNNLIISTIKTWSDTDPAAALAWLSANAKGAAYTNSIAGVLTNLSASDPAAALAYVAQLPESAQRETDYGTVLGQYAKDDPTAAFNWLNTNLTDNDHDTALASAVSQLAKVDPDTAAADYLQMPAGGPRDSITGAIADSLAAQDTQAALTWVQNLPADTADSVRSQAMKSVITAWKNVDPVAAANYVQNLATDPTLAGPIGGVAYAYAGVDGPGALAWAQALPAGPTQDNAVRSSITGLAQTDPQTAWQEASVILQQQGTINANTAINGPTLRQVITAWAETDPAGAAQAALNLTTAGTRVNSITAVATTWAQQDPDGLNTWMQTLPQGAERDAAVAQYVMTQASSDPAAAYRLATGIGDDISRYNQIVISLTAWAKKDPTAAQAALATAPITPAQQKTIANVIKK